MMNKLLKATKYLSVLISAVIFIQCSSEENDDSGSNGSGNMPSLTASLSSLSFEDTQVGQNSQLKSFTLSHTNLSSDINLTTTSPFELSVDGSTFSTQLNLPVISTSSLIFVRFIPDAINTFQENIVIQNTDIANDIVITLNGSGTPVIHNYLTFNRTRVAFGGGFNQTSVQSFNLHNDLSNIEAIKMYVKLTCPLGGCDEWDVYANVKVTDPVSG